MIVGFCRLARYGQACFTATLLERWQESVRTRMAIKPTTAQCM